MSKETQHLFSKAIKKSYMKQKNSSHTASSTAKTTGNLILNNSNYSRKSQKQRVLLLSFQHQSWSHLLSEWITDELLSQVSSDPEISAWLQNPEKMSLLNKIKTNPMELITSKNTKDKKVVQKISGILGNFRRSLNRLFCQLIHTQQPIYIW